MKSMIVVASLISVVSFSQFASADIPLPHVTSQTTTYGGSTAEAMYNSINTPVIPGYSSGYTGFVQNYKVQRSADGLQQVVCTESSNYRERVIPAYSCTVEKSSNGQPVPVFHPLIRMG